MKTFFRSTEEAKRFGVNANSNQVKLLRIIRNLFLDAAKSFPKGSSIEDLEKALFYATQAQFAREALEASGQI